MVERLVLWMVERFNLEPKLNRVIEWGEKLLGKAAVMEAEKVSIRAVLEGMEFDSKTDSKGDSWASSPEDTEDTIPWGEYPDLDPPLTADDDHRDLYLSDPDNHLDQ